MTVNRSYSTQAVLKREFHGRSPLSLPSVHARYAAPSTTLVLGTHCSLSNCDHAASQLLQTMSMMASFTAAQALKLYPLFMKAGKQASTGCVSCRVQACTLLIFLLQLPHPRVNNCRDKARPRLSKAQRILRRRDLPNHFFRGYFRGSKGGFLASMLTPL